MAHQMDREPPRSATRQRGQVSGSCSFRGGAQHGTRPASSVSIGVIAPGAPAFEERQRHGKRHGGKEEGEGRGPWHHEACRQADETAPEQHAPEHAVRSVPGQPAVRRPATVVAAGATLSSSESHAPHAPHWPAHCGNSAAHDWQVYLLFGFAIRNPDFVSRCAQKKRGDGSTRDICAGRELRYYVL